MDGSLGVGFKLTGLDISCASPDEINAFSKKIESLIIGLPEKIRLQVFYKLTDDAKSVIEEHKAAVTDDDPLYAPIANARHEFFEKKVQDGRLFVPEIYFFVRSDALSMKKRGLFEKKQEFQGFPVEQFTCQFQLNNPQKF